MKFDGAYPRVVLLDGTVTDTWSEGWRLECMKRNQHVQAVLRMLGKHNREAREKYYASVGSHEGAESERRVRAAVARAWEAERKRMEQAKEKAQ